MFSGASRKHLAMKLEAVVQVDHVMQTEYRLSRLTTLRSQPTSDFGKMTTAMSPSYRGDFLHVRLFQNVGTHTNLIQTGRQFMYRGSS